MIIVILFVKIIRRKIGSKVLYWIVPHLAISIDHYTLLTLKKSQINTQTDRQANRQTDRQAGNDRQTGRQRQTDRQATTDRGNNHIVRFFDLKKIIMERNYFLKRSKIHLCAFLLKFSTKMCTSTPQVQMKKKCLQTTNDRA